MKNNLAHMGFCEENGAIYYFHQTQAKVEICNVAFLFDERKLFYLSFVKDLEATNVEIW